MQTIQTQTRKTQSWWQISLMLVMLLVLSACGNDKKKEADDKDTPHDKVSIQLSWTHSVAGIPFYLAKDRGFYADQNLDVEIIEGGFAGDQFIVPIDEVVAGNAQFGIVDSANLLAARKNGVPVVAIAANVQRHPLALVSLKENNITRPSDLVGRTVDVSYPSVPNFMALLNSEGVDPAQVTIQDRTDLTIQSLVEGKVDVIDGWMITEVAELLASGEEINMIIPSDYGIEVYAEVIFTTEDMIKNNPELVQRFLDASLQGMQAAVDDPNSAVDVVVIYSSERARDVELSAMHQLLPLMLPSGSYAGEMTSDIWVYTQEMMISQQLLDGPLDDLSAAYTTQFLRQPAGR